MIEGIKNSVENVKFFVKNEGNWRGYSLQTGKLTFSNNDNFEGYFGISRFSKEEIKEHIFLISKAYVYAHETLDKLIKDEASEAELSKQDKLIKLIRSVLKELLSYEENYDLEVLEKYKNH